MIGCHQEQAGKAGSRWETGWAIRRGRVEMMGRLENDGNLREDMTAPSAGKVLPCFNF